MSMIVINFIMSSKNQAVQSVSACHWKGIGFTPQRQRLSTAKPMPLRRKAESG